MSRLISMEDAIRAIEEEWDGCCSEYPATQIIYDTTEAIERLPIIQPEITHEQAVAYLQSTGWMQEHDRQMMLDGAHRLTAQPEPHWIPVTEDIPDEERECWITPKTTSKVYRGVFTRHYGECHRTGFICDDGFMWLNTALAWMYCEVPEPYKGVTT